MPQLDRRTFLVGTGLAAAGLTLASCTTTGGDGSAALTFWSGFSTSDPNDKSKKPEDFWIYQASQRFTDKTGIPVKIEELPGDDTMFTKIRTAAIAGTGPDASMVWSGTYMLSIKEALEPMAKYWTDAEIAEFAGWAAVTDGFDPSVKDKILGVPNGSDGAMSQFINLELTEAAGVDATRWPVSYDEWMSDLEKIAATGVTPLSLGQLTFLFHAWNTWLAQTVEGSVGVGDLVTGKRNFSDPDILEMTEKWLAIRQYALPGAPTTDDDAAMQEVFDGNAAIGSGGAGTIPNFVDTLGDKALVTKWPNISENGIQGGTIGGTGVAYIVSNTSKQKENAVAYIKHLLSKDELEAFVESSESGPLVGRLDMEDVYADPMVNNLQQWSLEPSNTFWPDNVFPADLTGELAAQAELVWGDQISAEDFLTALDEKRDSLL